MGIKYSMSSIEDFQKLSKIIPKDIRKLIRTFKIRIEFDDHCHARPDKRTIYIKKDSNIYDICHEISHIICGWGCCREHCEWEAHGGAKILCEIFGVDKKEVEDAEDRMGCYAFRTKPEACGRYSP